MKDYKIIKSHDATGLTNAVKAKLEDGWEILGSHQVNVERINIQRASTVHMYITAYTQTMIKK